MSGTTKSGFWKMTPWSALLGIIMIVAYIIMKATGTHISNDGLLLAFGIIFTVGGASGGVYYIVKAKN